MNREELENLARKIAVGLGPGDGLFLTGELGVGKSVFARAVLRALGVEGPIPSPSFIVDAIYVTGDLEIHHIDLYRLRGDPGELEFYGIGDALTSDALVLVEWAERLPEEVLRTGTRVHISFTDDPDEREVMLNGEPVAGN